MSDKNDSILSFLKLYEKDEKVIKSIKEELDLYKNSNLATQAKFGETLIAFNKKMVVFIEDLLHEINNLKIELEEKDLKNKLLKNILDKNNVVCKDKLKELIDSNKNMLR